MSVDASFSVYHQVAQVQRESKVVRHRHTMSFISYEIENATLIDHARTRIFSSFQVMSKFLPQVERYKKLAAKAESVYVFGVPDIQPPTIPNIQYIDLSPDDQLAKEWFLVSYGPEYVSALATEELTHYTDPDQLRLFKGIWTFDFELVTQVKRSLNKIVGAQPLIHSPKEHNYSRQVQLMSQSLERVTAYNMRPRPKTSTNEELKVVIDQELRPALEHLRV
jgi:DICT domain-containing protein